MYVCKTKNVDMFNKVHVFELMKSHIYEPNVNLISLSSIMFHYANPRLYINKDLCYIYVISVYIISWEFNPTVLSVYDYKPKIYKVQVALATCVLNR